MLRLYDTWRDILEISLTPSLFVSQIVGRPSKTSCIIQTNKEKYESLPEEKLNVWIFWGSQSLSSNIHNSSSFNKAAQCSNIFILCHSINIKLWNQIAWGFFTHLCRVYWCSCRSTCACPNCCLTGVTFPVRPQAGWGGPAPDANANTVSHPAYCGER